MHDLFLSGDVEDHNLFLRSQEDNTREPVVSGTQLSLSENVKKNIECEFTVSNMLPAMDMYLGNSKDSHALNVSDDFYYLMTHREKSSSVGLPSQSFYFHFKNRHRYPKVKYHRKRFTCHTKMRFWKTYDLYVDILVKGKTKHPFTNSQKKIISWERMFSQSVMLTR